LKDMRSRQIIVAEERHLDDDLVKGYMHEGFGVMAVPDLSAAGKGTADYLLTVMADELEEFLKDGEQIVVLRSRRDAFTRSLLGKLSKRKLEVQVKEI